MKTYNHSSLLVIHLIAPIPTFCTSFIQFLLHKVENQVSSPAYNKGKAKNTVENYGTSQFSCEDRGYNNKERQSLHHLIGTKADEINPKSSNYHIKNGTILYQAYKNTDSTFPLRGAFYGSVKLITGNRG